MAARFFLTIHIVCYTTLVLWSLACNCLIDFVVILTSIVDAAAAVTLVGSMWPDRLGQFLFRIIWRWAQGAEGTLTISYAMLTIVFYLLGSLRHRSAEDYIRKKYLWAVNLIEKERDNHTTISQCDITSREILFLAPTFFVTNHHFHKQDCDIQLILWLVGSVQVKL